MAFCEKKINMRMLDVREFGHNEYLVKMVAVSKTVLCTSPCDEDAAVPIKSTRRPPHALAKGSERATHHC